MTIAWGVHLCYTECYTDAQGLWSLPWDELQSFSERGGGVVFRKLGVPFFGVPYVKDESILGSILGSPHSGKLSNPRRKSLRIGCRRLPVTQGTF